MPTFGYRHRVDEHPDLDAVARLAERARTLLGDGVDDPELRRAVDQYTADQANGEPLGTAKELLERVLERVDG